jgi:dihydrofolate reductase
MFRIEGFVIVSVDGMLANAEGIMPPELKNEADQQFFAQGLDRADVVVHGRHSHESQANSPRRRRLVLTRTVATIADDPEHPKALMWNPAGIAFAEACRALGLDGGVAAIIGGTDVFSLFLDVGYDAFHLSRASRARLPGGRPVFAQARFGRMPDDVLAQHGLEPGLMRVLDAAAAVTLITWAPRTTS